MIHQANQHIGKDDYGDADKLKQAYLRAEECHIQNIRRRYGDVYQNSGKWPGNESHRIGDAGLHDPESESDHKHHSHKAATISWVNLPLLHGWPDGAQQDVRGGVPECDSCEMQFLTHLAVVDHS